MRNKDWYDYNHAKMYLYHSIIRMGPIPIYVFDVNNDRIITYCKLRTRQEQKTIELYDPKINMVPVSLGFVNWKNVVYCITRRPVRKWRVGLTGENSYTYQYPNIHVIRSSSLFFTKALEDTIMGNFPSYQNVLDKKTLKKAFSRRFAIINDEIYYNMLKVPIGNTRPYVLYRPFEYLKQILEEDKDEKD